VSANASVIQFGAEINISPVHEILDEVPNKDMPTGGQLTKYWATLAWELFTLLEYAQKAKKPSIYLGKFRNAGSQYILEFWVSDLALEKRDQVNWHFQNTSQWLYAGAIVIKDGLVSSHH
jgi:hypothetical protein